MKITDYPSTTSLVDNNVFLIDGPSGTKNITAKDAASEFSRMNGGNDQPTLDILDTPEEIEANTESGKVAGALGVKGMYDKLGGFEPIIDAAGKITGYKTSVGGADTVFPFSSGNAVELIGNISDGTSIDLKTNFPHLADKPESEFVFVPNVIHATANPRITEGTGSVKLLPKIALSNGILTVNSMSGSQNVASSGLLILYTTGYVLYIGSLNTSV